MQGLSAGLEFGTSAAAVLSALGDVALLSLLARRMLVHMKEAGAASTGSGPSPGASCDTGSAIVFETPLTVVGEKSSDTRASELGTLEV